VITNSANRVGDKLTPRFAATCVDLPPPAPTHRPRVGAGTLVTSHGGEWSGRAAMSPPSGSTSCSHTCSYRDVNSVCDVPADVLPLGPLSASIVHMIA
jgi:hypothetical protein